MKDFVFLGKIKVVSNGIVVVYDKWQYGKKILYFAR